MCHCENCTSWPLSTFWRSKSENVNISETVRASAKMHRTPFKDLDICKQIRNVYLMTLIYFFRVKIEIFIFYIKQTVRASANMRTDFSIWCFSNILVFLMQIITKLILQICLHLYGIRRRVALVISRRLPHRLANIMLIIIIILFIFCTISRRFQEIHNLKLLT